MLLDLKRISSTLSTPYGCASCKMRPAYRNAPLSQSNRSLRFTMPSFIAPEQTTILNVEPGSATSLMQRLRRASAGDAPGLLGSNVGRQLIARISPVLG